MTIHTEIITDLDLAIAATERLHRRLIEAAVLRADDRTKALSRAQTNFETLALALGRDIKELQDA